MIPVLWHHSDSFWDSALPKYLLNRAAVCQHFVGLENAALGETAAIVIPGRHSTAEHDAINRAAAFYKRVVFMVTGDEESLFRADGLKHPNKVVWYFMPPFNPKQEGVDRVCINGWPSDAPFMIHEALRRKMDYQKRDLDFSFMGQVTHQRRIDCVAAAEKISNWSPEQRDASLIFSTPGFTQGKSRPEYYDVMARSKLVLCPSGPCTPDSFRVAEALEAGCIPIVDDLTPNPAYRPGYWNYALGTSYLPFPLIHDWSTLPSVVSFWLKHWKANAGYCSQWWKSKLSEWVDQLREDINGR